MDSRTQTTEKPDFDKVWLMFQETREQFKETREQFQDLKEIIAKSSLETDKESQETDKRFQDTDRQMKNLMKKMSESENRWGKFVESLVEGTLIKLLKAHQIPVQNTLLRQKGRYNGRQYETDIIAINGNDIVAVEVKTTLKPDDVQEFLDELTIFRQVYPIYTGKNVIGAVAYINVDGKADIMAEKQGLFVIKATGESAKIVNQKLFKPKYW